MIPLIDYGAIADLRKKMVASQAPQGQPELQPMPQVPIQAPLLAPAPPNQMLPVAEPRVVGAPPTPKKGLLYAQNPPEYDGMFNDAELNAARPGKVQSLLGRLIGESPQNIMRSNLDVMTRRKMVAQGYADKEAARQDAQTERDGLAAVRAEMPPPPDGNDYAATLSWNRQFIAKLMGRGLIKQAWQMSQYLDTTPPKESNGFQPQLFVGPDGKPAWITPGQRIPDGFKKPDTSNGTAKWFKLPDGTFKAYMPGEVPPKGAIDLETNRTNITVASAENRASNTLNSSRVAAFRRSIKPQTDRAPIIEQALVTLRDAADTSDPAKQRTLYSSAIANFVQAADQKAQLRWQLLNFFKSNVDPSIGGKWEVLKQRLMDGRLPQYTLRSMIAHLDNLKKMTGDEINRQREAEVRRHPSLDSELPDANEFFAGGFDLGGGRYSSTSQLTDAQLTEAARAGHTSEQAILDYWNKKP